MIYVVAVPDESQRTLLAHSGNPIILSDIVQEQIGKIMLSMKCVRSTLVACIAGFFSFILAGVYKEGHECHLDADVMD